MRLPVNVVNQVDERLRILRANLRKYYHIPDVQCSRIEKEKENLVDPSCDNASKLALSQKYLTSVQQSCKISDAFPKDESLLDWLFGDCGIQAKILKGFSYFSVTVRKGWEPLV